MKFRRHHARQLNGLIELTDHHSHLLTRHGIWIEGFDRRRRNRRDRALSFMAWLALLALIAGGGGLFVLALRLPRY